MKASNAMTVALLGLALVGCAGIDRADPEALNAEEARALVLRFHEAINSGDWQAADQMVTEDYRHYVVTGTGFSARSWQDFRKGNQAARQASPDWKNTPTQVVVEGDRVAVLLTGQGTHLGSFAGETPTGRTLTLPIVIFHEIRGRKLAADWEVADAGPLMRTLSKPAPAP
jgi:predicted ester cyclase